MALSVKQQALTRGKFDDFHQADDMRITSYAMRYYLNTPESNCPVSFPVDVTTRIQKSGASWPVGKWKTDVESDLKGINRFGSRLRVDDRLYNADKNEMNNTPLKAAPAEVKRFGDHWWSWDQRTDAPTLWKLKEQIGAIRIKNNNRKVINLNVRS